ncbi:MAG: ScpA family protein [Patescibacteria group bacterium]|nr:ScpA family protein [Patescibacteria group bacterium]
MSYTVKLEQFEGPLHALLQMIETEKLDISEISLAKVTDGYLNMLQDNPELPPEELADFLVVASKLLLIKSKLLLPFLYPEEAEAESEDLESQLRIYKAYLDASKTIEKRAAGRRFLYVHDKLPKTDIGFSPPKRLTTDQMREFFLAVAKRLEPVVKTEKRVIDKTVSLNEKIQQIRALFARAKRVSFKTLMKSSRSRMEVIVSFLALLELVKQKNVAVTQGGQFDDISITRVETAKVKV